MDAYLLIYYIYYMGYAWMLTYLYNIYTIWDMHDPLLLPGAPWCSLALPMHGCLLARGTSQRVANSDAAAMVFLKSGFICNIAKNDVQNS